MSVVPVLPRTSVWCGVSSRRCWSVPGCPATGERVPDDRRASSGRSRSSRAASLSSRAVTRSSRESPEPSAMWTPASGTPAAARSRCVDARAAARRAEPERLVADRLQHHLGGEVVAPVIHELQDLRERLRVDRRERDGVGARRGRRGAAGDDPARAEQLVEARRRRERGVGDERGCRAPRGRRRAPRAAATRCRRTTPASPGATRIVSKADSSPAMPPVTRRMPMRQRMFTSRLRSDEVSAGSPKPLRTSRPCQVSPARRPSPSTSVGKR